MVWHQARPQPIKFGVNNVVVRAGGAHHAALLPSSLRGRATAVFVTRFNVAMAYYSLTRGHILGGSSNLVLRVVYVAALVPIYVAMYVALNTMGHFQLMLLLFALLGGFSELYGIATYAEPGEVAYALAIAGNAVVCGGHRCGRVGAVLAAALAYLQDVGREDLDFALLSMVVFGGLLALLSLPETAVGAAADMAIANMDGNHRDLLEIMQNTSIPMRKKTKLRNRPASIPPTADPAARSPMPSSVGSRCSH
ncbi:hypothetical protein HPB51_011233 [Rhipicephalus microplus]|uniref:Uncharacterized protein n=1 Tax=Rhipicephalus microplus TaxID=6941 RepID=A0A9J6F1U9_RHIMP|nr:hypothetical protein HPB51_011233 [Rhipicephalus microplus]